MGFLPQRARSPYSAAEADLFDPGKRGDFFAVGPPRSDAALCAEMARLAYCRLEPDFGCDTERIRGLLSDRAGFKTCTFFESQGTPQGKGIHCFLALREGAEGRMAVVAFRGTDIKDPTNICFDADFEFRDWPRGGRVHQGFAEGLDEVLSRLDPAIQALGTCRLLYTGHSLGAALATLLASWRPPTVLYTFGSPRVGDQAFADTVNDVEHYRYQDCCDLVTRIPLETMHYVHVGKLCYIDRNRRISDAPGEVVLIEDHVLAQAEYAAEYAFRSGNVRVRDFADHAPINYVWPVTAA
jgi:Lipase (class 3)